MTRTTTLDKLLLADCNDRSIIDLQNRVEHLEKIIDTHKQEITFGGSPGRGADRKLWDAKGENWSDGYE